ncbi:hypothetical protein Tco_0052958 [Tanacetum coccineum]
MEFLNLLGSLGWEDGGYTEGKLGAGGKRYSEDRCCSEGKRYSEDRCCSEGKRYSEDICCSEGKRYSEDRCCSEGKRYSEDRRCLEGFLSTPTVSLGDSVHLLLSVSLRWEASSGEPIAYEISQDTSACWSRSCYVSDSGWLERSMISRANEKMSVEAPRSCPSLFVLSEALGSLKAEGSVWDDLRCVLAIPLR